MKMRIHRGSKVPGCLGGFSLIPAHRQVPDAGGWWILVDWDDSHGPKSSPWVMVKCDVDRRGSSMIILAMGFSLPPMWQLVSRCKCWCADQSEGNCSDLLGSRIPLQPDFWLHAQLQLLCVTVNPPSSSSITIH